MELLSHNKVLQLLIGIVIEPVPVGVGVGVVDRHCMRIEDAGLVLVVGLSFVVASDEVVKFLVEQMLFQLGFTALHFQF